MLFFHEDVRCAEGTRTDNIMGWFGFFSGLLFYTEDARCAEGIYLIPGNILRWFGGFSGLCYSY